VSFVESRRSTPSIAIYSNSSGKRVVFAGGGARKARTNVDLIVRGLKQKERVWSDLSQGWPCYSSGIIAEEQQGG